MADSPSKMSPLTVAKVVFWSFLGIRRSKDHAADSVHLKPAQVVVAGLIGAALLVTSLIVLVKFVIGRAA